MMEVFDDFVNNVISPASVPAGVGTVFLTFFTGKLAPKLPAKFYKLLDNAIVRIIIVSFLLNQQIHKPSLSVIISTVLIVVLDLLVKFFAPDTPPLSELVKPSTTSEDDKNVKSCNCYCGGPIYTNGPPPKNGEVAKPQNLPQTQQQVHHAVGWNNRGLGWNNPIGM